MDMVELEKMQIVATEIKCEKHKNFLRIGITKIW